MKQILLFAGMLFTGSSFAQYCTSGGPTSTADSNVQLVRIVGVGDSIHFIGCPGVLGVQNLTSLSTTLNATNSYSLSVQYGTCNGNYQGAGEVWIDYDQSGTFDTWESIGTWTGIPPVPVTVYNFTVPAAAQNGATRMRVMQHEGGNIVPPLDPCASFQWGSVMDFTINITGGIDCSAYIGDDTLDPIIVTSLPYTNNGDNSYCYGNQNHVYPSPDVYYLVRPSVQSSSIHATLCGSSFDTFLSVIDPQGNVIAYNDDAPGCAPQSELTFASAGLDTVYVIVEGWGSFSGTYTLQITENLVGIEEYIPHPFALSPNPAQDYFVISGGLKSDILITDLLGNTVERISNYNGEQISTGNYSAGIYFVQFTWAGHLYSEKIIITE